MIKTAATLLCFTSFAMTSPRHGYATFGELLYPADFERFSYTLDNPYEGGELHLAELGTFDSFNPFILRGQTPSYAFLLNKVYATLLAPAKDEPASSYAYVAKSIDLDEKSKWCDFHLNEMAVFSDGSAITAHDVVFSFTILVEKGLPQFKAYYQHIVKAEALDDYTVRFHFNETKNRELPLIVGQLPILSKKYYETHAFDAPSLEKAPTSGPYVIEKCEPGRLLSYKKVKNWWGKEVASQKNQHNYELITVYYFRDNNTMFEAFKSGQVDFRMENVSKQLATEYTFDAVKRGDIVRLELANTMSSLTVGYFMNLRRHTFKDPLVRKGISILLDFEWLKKNIFYNLYDRNNSYFPKSEFDSSKGLNEKSLALLKDLKRTYPDDVSDDVFKEPDIFPVLKSEEDTRLTIQKAQELFKKAGYELKDGVLVKDGKPFSFEVLLKDKIYERFTLNFVNLLKKAGIQVGIRLVDTATYFERIESYEFDM
ncbi:MAG TPA: extracellular solute-binding protein, partial [Alphaproteobacteria bacterium]|nr:extracellular solute-binding protein [Alphaproteobacteria bacterium]